MYYDEFCWTQIFKRFAMKKQNKENFTTQLDCFDRLFFTVCHKKILRFLSSRKNSTLIKKCWWMENSNYQFEDYPVATTWVQICTKTFEQRFSKFLLLIWPFFLWNNLYFSFSIFHCESSGEFQVSNPKLYSSSLFNKNSLKKAQSLCRGRPLCPSGCFWVDALHSCDAKSYDLPEC